MEEINAARATIEQLTNERNELDKNSISYAQIHTNITNDIVARTTLLNTLISQQGNSLPDLLFQFQILTDNILLQTLHPNQIYISDYHLELPCMPTCGAGND